MNIGIFGITGNPPHLGHWRAMNIASQQLDQVWVSPVFKHPFGKTFLCYDIRKTMLQAMMDDLPINNVVIKDLDRDLFKELNTPIYSYVLLTELKNRYPEHNFKLVVGMDNYQPEVWKKFYRHQDIVNDFGVIVIDEQGQHSTDIRKMLQTDENISNLVSPTVFKMIKQQNLYKEKLP